jgi:hypothetical protein
MVSLRWASAIIWRPFIALAGVLAFLLYTSCAAQDQQTVIPLQVPEGVEVCRIAIVNEKGGEIAVSQDEGKTWDRIGTVTRPADQVDRKAYTAAKWAKIGTVAATAVNAIHIKTDENVPEDRGVVFSLLPKEFAEPATAASYLSPSSSIYTDIPGGTAIFGGRCSPFVGSPVMIEKECALTQICAGYIPAAGDHLVVIAQRPKAYPCFLEFENRFGGLITIIYCDGTRKLVGQVLRPVEGVGRFSGALYAGIGRIRANHTGVIDVSVSPLGSIAGFQIIPSNHAMSPEMIKARTSTQWMVVGPVCATDAPSEGLPPLFFGYLRPVYDTADLYADDWGTRLLSRFLVEAKREGQDWGAVPVFELDPDMNKPLPEWANTALTDITAFRILFPQEPAAPPDCHSERPSGPRGGLQGPRGEAKNPTFYAPTGWFKMGCFVRRLADSA